MSSEKTASLRTMSPHRTRLNQVKRFMGSVSFVHSVLIAPVLIFYIPLRIFPIIFALGMSFTRWSGMGVANIRWIGIGNYLKLPTDSLFLNSLKVTALYVGIVTPALLLLSIVIAVALDRQSWSSELAKGAILIPLAASPVTIGLLFKLLVSPSIGLPTLFKDNNVDLLLDSSGALLVVAFAHIWSGLGLNTFVFLTGLQAIPGEIYEAAMLDGAGSFNRFRLIIFPLLRESMIMNAIVVLIGAFQAFGHIFILTGGGPYHGTEVIGMYMYIQAFWKFQYGYGSAVAVVMTAIIGAITFLQMRITRSGTTVYF